MMESGMLQTLAFIILPFSLAVPIDNGVLGYPEVTCGPHSIQVDVATQKAFQGRLFVMGESHRPDCVRPNAEPGYGGSRSPSSSTGYGSDSIGIQLKFGECNMRRQRTLYPRGVEYTFTLVVRLVLFSP